MSVICGPCVVGNHKCCYAKDAAGVVCTCLHEQNKNDPINPSHYKSHPSGIQCITVTRHYGFNIGNVIKYLWRAGLKNSGDVGTARLEDYKKARWYLEDEIIQLEQQIEERKP